MNEQKRLDIIELLGYFTLLGGSRLTFIRMATILSCFTFLKYITTASKAHKFQLPKEFLDAVNNLQSIKNITIINDRISDPTSFTANRKSIPLSDLDAFQKQLQSFSKISQKLRNSTDVLIPDTLRDPISATGTILNEIKNTEIDFTYRLLGWVNTQSLDTDREQFELAFDLGYLVHEGTFSFSTPWTSWIYSLVTDLAKPTTKKTSIYDPNFKLGTLLCSFYEKFHSFGTSTLHPDTTLYGLEQHDDSFIIGYTRLLLMTSGNVRLEIKRNNALNIDQVSSEGFDIAFADLTKGFGTPDSSSFLSKDPPSDTVAREYILHTLSQLSSGGRALFVVTDRLLSGKHGENWREKLLMNHTVESILSLPMPSKADQKKYKFNKNILVIRQGGYTKKVKMADGISWWEENKLKPKLDDMGGATFPIDEYLNSLQSLIHPENTTSYSWDIDAKDLAQYEYDLAPKNRNKNNLGAFLDKLKETNCSVMPLKNCCKILTGNQIPSSEVIDQPYYNFGIDDNDIFYVRIKDVRDNIIHYPKTLLSKNASSLLKDDQKLHAGDILLSKSGTIGKTAIVKSSDNRKYGDTVNLVASSSFFVLRPGQEVVNVFLRNYLNSSLVKEWLANQSRGTTIQYLTKSALENLPILVPDINTQCDLAIPDKTVNTDFLEYLRDKLSEKPLTIRERMNVILSMRIDLINANQDLNFKDIEDFLISIKKDKEQFITEFKKNEDRTIFDWFVKLLESFESIAGITKIPDPDGIWMLLTSTIDTLDDFIHDLVRVDECQYITGYIECIDPNMEQIVNNVNIIMGRLYSASHTLLEDIKITFRHARPFHSASKLNINTNIEYRVIINNSGSLPLKSLNISGKLILTEPSQNSLLKSSENSYIDWGTFHCPYIAREELYITLKGKTPKQPGNYTLLLSWEGLSLDGTKRAGSAQLPLIVGKVINDSSPVKKELGGSPYVVGDPVGDNKNVFFGRERIIESIRLQIINSGNVVLLEGNRRSGKTSILHYLQGVEKVPGWLSVYCSLQGAEGSRSGVGLPTEQVFREIARSISIGMINNKIDCPLPNGKTQPQGKKIGISKACREGISLENPFADFRDYLEICLEILKKNKLGLLLMTDEFDKLQEGIDNGITSPQVPENIRFLIHQHQSFSAILTGSRRLKRLREEYWSALFGLGTRESVTALELDAAERLITNPSKGQLIFAEDAINRICILTAQQPYLIQCLCNRIFDLASRENNHTITLDFVDKAADIFIENNEHFSSLWGYAESDQCRFILALLQNEFKNSRPLSLETIKEQLFSNGIEISDDVLIQDLEKLQELELIKLMVRGDYKEYQIEVPLMGYWIDSQQDFNALLSKARNEAEEMN